MTNNAYGTLTSLDGFLSIDAYELFCNCALLSTTNNKNILEIGVFCGRSLLGLAVAFSDAKSIVGVDPFYINFTDSPALPGEGEYLNNASHKISPNVRIEEIYKTAKKLQSINGNDITKKIKLVKTTQDDFISSFKGQKFFVSHIDGEHTFDAVKNFLDKTSILMEKNSFIIIDDILNSGFPGIAEAVFTHKDFKKRFFPLIYGFNKGIYLYNPSTGKVASYQNKLKQFYSLNTYIQRPLHDGSFMVYRREIDAPIIETDSPIEAKNTLFSRLKVLLK